MFLMHAFVIAVMAVMSMGVPAQAQKAKPAARKSASEQPKPAQQLLGAALLEHYVCVISPVEDESLSPDVVRVMSVSVRWPWHSGLHDAA